MLKKKRLPLIALSLLLPFLLHAQEASQPDHLQILKRDKGYNLKQVQKFPEFTYEDKSADNLQALRTTYNLDSVAGNGTDLNKAMNLLAWMHNTVPHEDEYNHPVLNAKNIIETYKEKKIAQGCYPLAITMNELFLAMGYKSRVVICYSSDFEHPNGGHVINIVYIPSLKKWIWMDPQFNAYLKDKEGNFLDIAEVRERVISGKPIFLNGDANYHGDPVDINYYLSEFMLEHLYRFISPLHSKYDSETRADGKQMSYVELLPVKSKTPTTGIFESHSTGGIKVTSYHTNNPAVFWKIP